MKSAGKRLTFLFSPEHHPPVAAFFHHPTMADLADGDGGKPGPTPQERVGESPLLADLGTLLPLEIREVSTAASPRQRTLFENLLYRHHYLSYRGSVGENLQ